MEINAASVAELQRKLKQQQQPCGEEDSGLIAELRKCAEIFAEELKEDEEAGLYMRRLFCGDGQAQGIDVPKALCNLTGLLQSMASFQGAEQFIDEHQTMKTQLNDADAAAKHVVAMNEGFALPKHTVGKLDEDAIVRSLKAKHKRPPHVSQVSKIMDDLEILAKGSEEVPDITAPKEEWVTRTSGGRKQPPMHMIPIEGLERRTNGEFRINDAHEAWLRVTEEHGAEACQAVKHAYRERQQGELASGGYNTEYVWDYKANRKALPADIIRHLGRMVPEPKFAAKDEHHTFFRLNIKVMKGRAQGSEACAQVNLTCPSRRTVNELKLLIEIKLLDSIRQPRDSALSEKRRKAEEQRRLKSVRGDRKCKDQHLFLADGCDGAGYGRELGIRPATVRNEETYDPAMELYEAQCGLDRAAFALQVGASGREQPIVLFLHEANAPTPSSASEQHHSSGPSVPFSDNDSSNDDSSGDDFTSDD